MVNTFIMKGWLGCLVLAVLVRTTLSCKFIVSAPNVFRVPSEAAVHVLVEGANNVTVHVSLKGLGVEARSDLPNGKVKKLTLPLFYNNTMKLLDRDNNGTLVATFTGGCNAQRETNIIITFRSCIVAIQTDKPIYKTRDPQAHFRFYPVTPSLKPLDEEVRCYIRDNESIIIEDFRDPLRYTLNTANPRQRIKGLFLRSMALERIYPRSGTYQATCFCGKRFATEYTTLFQIDEYVLPSFSAQIMSAPQCIKTTSKTIPVALKVEYTSGEAVYDSFGTIETGVVNRPDIPKVVRKGYKFNQPGVRSVVFDVRLPGGDDDIHPVVGDTLYVKVFWHESGSDYRAEDVWTGTMYAKEPIVPKLVNVPEYFQPGQTVSFLVCSKSCAGSIKTQQHMTVTKTVDGLVEESTGVTDALKGGCYATEIDTLTTTTEVTIQAKLTDGIETDTKVLKRASVCSAPSSLSRHSDGKPATAGSVERFTFKVVGLNGDATVVFQVNSAGMTVAMSQLTTDLRDDVIYEFTVPRDVSTSMTVVAYAYAATGSGCTVASKTVPVEMALPNKATLKVNHNGEVQYRSQVLGNLFDGKAEPGSTIVLMAQDEALMVLKRQARLPDGFSLDRIQQYQGVFNPVCHEGVGPNSAALLENSGVALLSNTGLPDSSRYHLSCNPIHDDARRRRREAGEEEVVARRRECWERPCQQLKDALVEEHCAKNEYQTADGECERKKRDSIPFQCEPSGCFQSEAKNETHCWCVNAIGETIKGTTVEGFCDCFDYFLCRSSDMFTGPEGCELDCSGEGYQRANNGCAICQCNKDAADLGGALALGCNSCEDIDSNLYSLAGNYTSAILRCSCHSASQSGAILGRSYCCPFGARAFDFAAASSSILLGLENNQFLDPDLVEARKDFKSSWLLDDSMIIADSQGKFRYTPEAIPDAITKYHITMAAMHPEKGLGMAFSTLTVTTPLQVRTIVPYSVTVQEDFTVRCTVHHFGSDRLVVRVSLIVSSELCLDGNNRTARSELITFRSRGVQWRSFEVKAIEATSFSPAFARCVAQTYNLNIKDANQQDVHIEPEGERVHTSVNIPVDCDADSACIPGSCRNGGTPVEGLRCCYCQCPPEFTGENCTESVQALDMGGHHASFMVHVTPRLLYLNVDNDIHLACSIRSIGLDRSTAVYSWKRASRRALPEQAQIIDGALWIKDVAAEDQDEYICEVTLQGSTVAGKSTVVIGSRCPSNISSSDNPCALRFFKPGNPLPSLVGFSRKPNLKQQVVTVDLSVNDAVLAPKSKQCRVFVRGEYKLPLPALELLNYDRLQGLIRLPRGCGEQTLLALTPLVYAMNYLEDGGLLLGNKAKREEGIKNIRRGVQRMRNHRIGRCFSVWRTKRPSVWVGALATQTFCKATRWGLPFRALRVISPALGCLVNAQRQDGSFKETSSVYHKDMRGSTRLSKDVPLTALVLLSLVDCSESDFHSSAVANAISYLQTGFSEISSNFQLALATYSLCKAGDKVTARDGIQRLWAAASSGPAGLYWTKLNSGTLNHDVPFDSLTIETTAYVLLAMICMGEDAIQLRPIADILAQQYNPSGGFVSSQETVVAIKAMIEFARVNTLPPLSTDFRVDLHDARARASSRAAHIAQVSVNTYNLNRRHEMIIPKDVSKIRLTATGSGRGIMQVACDYSILDTCNKCPFDVGISFVETGNRIAITVQVRWSADYKYIDNDAMFIVDLDFFSGYSLTERSKKSLGQEPDVGLVEDKKQGIVIYLDRVPHPDEDKKTLNIIAVSEATHQSGQSTPAVLRVYDYYDPDRRCEVSYSRASTSRLNSVCAENGQCGCVAGTCPVCDNRICDAATSFFDRYTAKAELDRMMMNLEKYICREVDFVYRVLLMSSEEVSPTSSWMKIKVKVRKIIKNGEIDFEDNKRKILYFYLSKSCTTCGDFFSNLSRRDLRRMKRNYYIFGKDGTPLVLEGGARILQRPKRGCGYLVELFQRVENGVCG